MRILVTNDDGIEALGLGILEKIAKNIAGEKGEVWTIAPQNARSGVAHCVSFATAFAITKHSKRRIAVDGYPADCVLVGLSEIMNNHPPDLVLSGVNRGNNSSENVTYSGTIGAAIEATLQGVKAIALSQYLGAGNRGADADIFDAAATYGTDIIKTLLEKAPWEEQRDYQLFYNVNFPPYSADNVKGIKIVPQGLRQKRAFSIKKHMDNDGKICNDLLRLTCLAQTTPSQPNSDGAVNLDGFISITPMRADFTAHKTIPSLQEIFS